MLDHLDDIESDLSVFHGIRDPMAELDSPRYFRFAERLEHYGGAVTAARGRPAWQETPAGPPPTPAQPPAQPDIATVAAMSQHQGFPGIAYTRG